METSTPSTATTMAFDITPSQANIGDTVTFEVLVASANTHTPTGTVTFYNGSASLAQVALAGGKASLSVSTAAYAPGTYQLTAKYAGDTNNAADSADTNLTLVSVVSDTISISPAGAALSPGGQVQFSVPSAAAGSTITWYANGTIGGSASAGTISATGLYTAPSTASAVTVSISANVSAVFGPPVPVYIVPAGSVTTSNNGQVAAYTISVPDGGQMSVEFGTDTTYGRNTWQQPAPSGGGPIRMLVAGMNANTLYHMRADVVFPGGITFTDSDMTFTTTQSLATGTWATGVVLNTPGLTPQPGIELVEDFPPPGFTGAYDLKGNLIWALPPPSNTSSIDGFQPAMLLANGNILYQSSPESSYSIDGVGDQPGTTFTIREVQLDGTLVTELTMAQLQAALNASGYLDGLGNQPTLLDMHHEIGINPTTGHWILDTNATRVYTNLTGYSAPVTVLGDILIDYNPTTGTVGWVWNTFDHLDVNRHPMLFPDWTHTNAIVYSADDHNILVSMRHQNWILKLDYNDGAGSGNIIWHFGYEGDFTLENGVSPTDWQYAQHRPSFTTSNTTGTFGLTMMDNGDDRVFPAGVTCQNGTSTPCQYSQTPIFTVNETNMTATLDVELPAPSYSVFGGDADLLANGDVESDYCAASGGAIITEYQLGTTPQLVFGMQIPGHDEYRALRIGSLYPGVTWTK